MSSELEILKTAYEAIKQELTTAREEMDDGTTVPPFWDIARQALGREK